MFTGLVEILENCMSRTANINTTRIVSNDQEVPIHARRNPAIPWPTSLLTPLKAIKLPYTLENFSFSTNSRRMVDCTGPDKVDRIVRRKVAAIDTMTIPSFPFI
ncbi:hypothetical protein PcaKH15_17730 [Parageobacillus caldoxylosilyticus]|nr:hypothetical protein PcaKH15_17730 [Parageobacillus caldoxylosilyticus]BDG39649.1 hypothetical protein PcaKH16_17880 [Parageobacillus caldoxylosilyticus]BDG43421.1 hypothetical protein PcaKH35_17660 [Parageobacillus caldoxylosilyticus]